MNNFPDVLVWFIPILGFGWIMFDSWKHQRIINKGVSQTTRAENPMMFWGVMSLYLFFFLAGVFELVSSFSRR